MLDEIREFQEYTMDLDTLWRGKKFRLQYLTLTNALSGLERAMTIICRHYMFHGGMKGGAPDAPQLTEILKAWCGFPHAPTSGAKALQGWLTNYICQILLRNGLENNRPPLANEVYQESMKILAAISPADPPPPEVCLEKLAALEKIKDFPAQQSCLKKIMTSLKDLSYKSKSLPKDIFPANPKIKENDYKAITYEKIIANAFVAGPLKRYYLVAASDPFQGRIENLPVSYGNREPYTKKFRNNDRDLILKVTAAYLLQNKTGSKEYVTVSQTDIANWMASKQNPTTLALDKYRFQESKEPLFQKQTFGNIIKLRLAPEWRAIFSLAEEAPQQKSGAIFYSDPGSRLLLREGEEYDPLP